MCRLQQNSARTIPNTAVPGSGAATLLLLNFAALAAFFRSDSRSFSCCIRISSSCFSLSVSLCRSSSSRRFLASSSCTLASEKKLLNQLSIEGISLAERWHERVLATLMLFTRTIILLRTIIINAWFDHTENLMGENCFRRHSNNLTRKPINHKTVFDPNESEGIPSLGEHHKSNTITYSD